MELNLAKEKLETQLENVRAELLSIGNYIEETDDWEAKPETEMGASDADENSHADSSEELSTRTATLESLEKSYRDIKRALTKIANGNYGLCEVCGATIEAGRLTIKPDARTCLLHLNDENSLPL